MAVFKKLIFIFKNKLFNGLFDRMPLNKDVVLVKYIIRNSFCSIALVFLVGVFIVLKYR